MKHLRLLGIVAATTVALISLAGLSTAGADELCTTSESPCTNNKILKVEESQVGSATFATTEGTVLITCKGLHLKYTVSNQGPGIDPITATIDSLTFTECTNTMLTLKRGTFDASAKSASSGTRTLTGTEWTINGIFGASCVYGASAGLDIGATTGTELVINSVVTRVSGGFTCPATVVWKATLRVTNHNSVNWVNN